MPCAPSCAPARRSSSTGPGSSRSSWPARGAEPSTCARRSTSAPGSASATCPCPRRRRGRGRRGRLGGDRRARLGARRGARGRAPGGRAAPQPQVHLRAVRDRRGQPAGPRRGPGGGGAARSGLQPALDPRPARARQDPPPARDRQLRAALRLRADASATPPSRSSPPTSSRRCATGAPDDFKQRFRGSDVVLIDDVQFLARKERTREEFFHTFNALQDSGRQLVLTSDRSPEDLTGLEDRLAERFRSGLVVELDAARAPGAPRDPREARAAGRRRCLPRGARRDRRARDELSVRALEGSLIQVVAHASRAG